MKSHNLHDGTMSILFFLQTNEDEDPVQFDIAIEQGYYRDVYDLVRTINA